MAPTWQKYQAEAAAFFQKLGFDACLNHKIKGARATHAADVWVTHSRFGIKVKWLVECKLWKTAVTKEKVMALTQIAQDIGADKAFLLSERGFQSGAIEAAKNSNVLLSSLETLVANASHEISVQQIVASAKRVEDLNARLRALMCDDKGRLLEFSGLEPDEVTSPLGTAFALQLAIWKALSGRYPVFFHGDNVHDSKSCNNPASFAKLTRRATTRLAQVVSGLESRAQEKRNSAHRELLKAIENLMAVSHVALFEKQEGEAGFEEDRLAALAAMKRLGNAFEKAKCAAYSDHIFGVLSDLRQTIIDTVYLHLTKPKVRESLWRRTENEVRGKVKRYVAAVGIHVR